MKAENPSHGVAFVLFGAAGDLCWRLVVPALFDLYVDGHLPERFLLIGVDRADHDDASLAARYRSAIAANARHAMPDERVWREFAGLIHYLKTDVADPAGVSILRERLAEWARDVPASPTFVFYLATPPALFAPVARALAAVGLARDRERTRIVVEKPLGHDLASFRDINAALTTAFSEPQIFRIDHFLGRETVQNILALRFANSIFEPVWNRRYVDHVAITVAETLGVEHRGAYYERAGALRDMVQNHLLQLLCLVAMEPPVAYDADDVRGKKLDVLRALRPVRREAVANVAARGQYGAGWINGVRVPAYREEPGIDPRSTTETYAALKLYVDNWRWQEVPFYLRTGKRLAADVSEISIRFRDVPHRAYPASVGLSAQPARLVIQMQPEQGIVLKFMAKEPGSPLRLRPVDMRFSYREAFGANPPAAYETLLRDVLSGDATLFMRADQVEAAWRLLMPVLDVWADNPAPNFPNYAAGSWGPEPAEALVARDGKSWLTPTLMRASPRTATPATDTPASGGT